MKNKIYVIIIIIAIATRRPHLHSHQSNAPQYIKTLDSTALNVTEAEWKASRVTFEKLCASAWPCSFALVLNTAPPPPAEEL
jgi:hypothetical protein